MAGPRWPWPWQPKHRSASGGQYRRACSDHMEQLMITDPLALLVHSSPPDEDGMCLDISVESAEWEFTGLIVRQLEPDSTIELATRRDEIAVVLLGGDCEIGVDSQQFRLNSRSSIFEGPPSAVYLPLDTEFSISSRTT